MKPRVRPWRFMNSKLMNLERVLSATEDILEILMKNACI